MMKCKRMNRGNVKIKTTVNEKILNLIVKPAP